MKKTVDEYMSLPYSIEITPDGDSYFVKIKELEGCMSVGSSKSDALVMIEDAMREWLTVAIEEGNDIPLPKAMQVERYSGKFPLRLPKTLHRKLAESAERDGISLNQHLVMLLSERNALADIKRMLADSGSHPCSVPLVGPDDSHDRTWSVIATSDRTSTCNTVHETQQKYSEKKNGTAKIK